jgi:hypothetical protein
MTSNLFKRATAENLHREISTSSIMADRAYEPGGEETSGGELFRYWVQRKYMFMDFAIKTFDFAVPAEISSPNQAKFVLDLLELQFKGE